MRYLKLERPDVQASITRLAWRLQCSQNEQTLSNADQEVTALPEQRHVNAVSVPVIVK
jgi:hypothetical protein